MSYFQSVAKTFCFGCCLGLRRFNADDLIGTTLNQFCWLFLVGVLLLWITVTWFLLQGYDEGEHHCTEIRNIAQHRPTFFKKRQMFYTTVYQGDCSVQIHPSKLTTECISLNVCSWKKATGRQRSRFHIITGIRCSYLKPYIVVALSKQCANTCCFLCWCCPHTI